MKYFILFILSVTYFSLFVESFNQQNHCNALENLIANAIDEVAADMKHIDEVADRKHIDGHYNKPRNPNYNKGNFKKYIMVFLSILIAISILVLIILLIGCIRRRLLLSRITRTN
ncbi:hypothetical protein BmR1_04g05456 [Babesia microti strain RI]|uniref:Uncharacterized protein n=1 Tax=Babesia microti (strain RI) TaxID=1133968 RepID=A0A1N6LXF7_BABMR|nr:hypothetical protein BmR1_04g05456 [Babesia microti strain RI]SIO73555.1 hypothetical protein BmR1_04g05456 [Babesia microti strain RI]|eukprot:XP_021337643.1 hypothetical protein BmR1_04g05456 [Babesia microti strain RI]